MTETAAHPAPALIRHFIDGRPVESSRPTFPCHDPATGAVAAQVHEADRETVDLAVQAAKRALKGPWAKPRLSKRKFRRLRRFQRGRTPFWAAGGS